MHCRFGEITVCLLASCTPTIPPLLRRIKQKRQNSSNNLHKQRGSAPLLRSAPITKSTKCAENITFLGKAKDSQNSDDNEDPYLLDDIPGNKSDQTGSFTARNDPDRIMVSRSVNISSAPYYSACDLAPMSEAHIRAWPGSEYS